MSKRQARNLNFDKDEWTDRNGKIVTYKAIVEAQKDTHLYNKQSSEIIQPENASAVKKRKREDTESSDDGKPGPSKLHQLESRVKELEASQNALSKELQETKRLIEVEQQSKNRAVASFRATIDEAFTCVEKFLDEEEIFSEFVTTLGKHNIEITRK